MSFVITQPESLAAAAGHAGHRIGDGRPECGHSYPTRRADRAGDGAGAVVGSYGSYDQESRSTLWRKLFMEYLPRSVVVGNRQVTGVHLAALARSLRLHLADLDTGPHAAHREVATVNP